MPPSIILEDKEAVFCVTPSTILEVSEAVSCRLPYTLLEVREASFSVSRSTILVDRVSFP